MEALEALPRRGQFEVLWLPVAFDVLDWDLNLKATLRMTVADAAFFELLDDRGQVFLQLGLNLVDRRVGDVKLLVDSGLWLRDLCSIGTR